MFWVFCSLCNTLMLTSCRTTAEKDEKKERKEKEKQRKEREKKERKQREEEEEMAEDEEGGEWKPAKKGAAVAVVRPPFNFCELRRKLHAAWHLPNFHWFCQYRNCSPCV